MPRDVDELQIALKTASDDDQFATVVVIAREILTHKPNDALTLLRLGRALAATARYGEAESTLYKSLELCRSQNKHVVYVELGNLFQYQGANHTAAEWFQKAVNKKPDDSDACIFLGAALARDGRLEEAEAAHRMATQCSEGCIDEAYLNLALVLLARERYQEARACLERSLEIDPDYKEARSCLDDIIKTIKFIEQT